VVIDPLSAAIALGSTVVSYIQQAKVVTATTTAVGASAAGVVVVQLATTAFLAKRLTEIKEQVSRIEGHLLRVQKKVEQVQRVQVGQAAVPILHAIGIIDELAVCGEPSPTAAADAARAVALLEQGSRQIEAVVRALRPRELLELTELVEPLLATLDFATVFEVALKLAEGQPPERLRLILARHADFLRETHDQLAGMPRFDQVPPDAYLLALATRLGSANPAALRRSRQQALGHATEQWKLTADNLLLCGPEPT